MAGPGRIELPVPLLESGGLPLTDGPKLLQLFNFGVHRVLTAAPAVFLQLQLLFQVLISGSGVVLLAALFAF